LPRSRLKRRSGTSGTSVYTATIENSSPNLWYIPGHRFNWGPGADDAAPGFVAGLAAVHRKLEEAIRYIERNPKLVKSITSFPYIVKSL
jgi:hypothetical protein